MAQDDPKPRKELSPKERAYIWGLSQAGKSNQAISQLLNRSRTTIFSVLRQIRLNFANQVDNPFKSKSQSRRPRKLDPRGERRLLRAANAERKSALAILATPSKSSTQLSQFTVRETLQRYGKGHRKARKKPYVSKVNRRKRLAFEQVNRHTPWALICWSDEAYFYISEDNTPQYVTRSSSKEYLSECLQATFKSGRESIGVWGCFIGPKRGPLVVLPKGIRFTHKKYFTYIFLPYFLPFVMKMRDKYRHGVQMQEDGASYHHGGIVDAVKRLAQVRTIL